MNKYEFKHINLIQNEIKLNKKNKVVSLVGDDYTYDFAFSKTKELYKFYSCEDLKYELDKLNLCITCKNNENATFSSISCVILSCMISISVSIIKTEGIFAWILVILDAICLFGLAKALINKDIAKDNIIVCTATIKAIEQLIEEKQQSSNKIGTLEY